ncbi:uncharacterized protein [Prorops nasuta]|uniref:uncharacterized protein n=1 Tax=Prorops nasuta TaxID=863751 RepID=UPI0034CF971E
MAEAKFVTRSGFFLDDDNEVGRYPEDSLGFLNGVEEGTDEETDFLGRFDSVSSVNSDDVGIWQEAMRSTRPEEEFSRDPRGFWKVEASGAWRTSIESPDSIVDPDEGAALKKSIPQRDGPWAGRSEDTTEWMVRERSSTEECVPLKFNFNDQSSTESFGSPERIARVQNNPRSLKIRLLPKGLFGHRTLKSLTRQSKRKILREGGEKSRHDQGACSSSSLIDSKAPEVEQTNKENIPDVTATKGKQLLRNVEDIIDSMETNSLLNLVSRESRKNLRTPFTLQTSDNRPMAQGGNNRLAEVVKPKFRNRQLERCLDEAMRRALKRYVHRCDTWESLVLPVDPPRKRRKILD